MTLMRNQVTVDGITFNAEPFEWPRSLWEVLEIKLTTRTGWHDLTAGNLASLNALYNGAQGSAEMGLEKWLVQYIGGTGPTSSFTVTDWRGNTGSFVFRPNDGFAVEEVQGAAEAAPLTGGFWTATIRLLQA